MKTLNRLLPGLSLIAALVAILWFANALAQQAPGTFRVQDETGRIFYEGTDQNRAFQACRLWTSADPARSCRITEFRARDGVRHTLSVFNSSDTGVWTWVAPTALENGNILTDLSHYLVYRHLVGQQPALWASIDGRVARAVMSMGPADFGGCFWVLAVRKPATSPPVASDKSNTICMDAQGQPLPAT